MTFDWLLVIVNIFPHIILPGVILEKLAG